MNRRRRPIRFVDPNDDAVGQWVFELSEGLCNHDDPESGAPPTGVAPPEDKRIIPFSLCNDDGSGSRWEAFRDEGGEYYGQYADTEGNGYNALVFEWADGDHCHWVHNRHYFTDQRPLGDPSDFAAMRFPRAVPSACGGELKALELGGTSFVNYAVDAVCGHGP